MTGHPTNPDTAETARRVDPARLRRIQWGLRGTLAIALLVSMAANVLHARPDVIAQSVAAWSPLALYAAIEVMTRVPIRNRRRATIRIISTTTIAAIAALTSYQHMHGMVERYGETGVVPYLLPLSVDGLIAVLSVSLFDIAEQLRTTVPPPAHTSPALPPQDTPEPSAAPASTETLPSTSATTRPRPERPRIPKPDSKVAPSGGTPPDGDTHMQPLLAAAQEVYRELQAAGRPVTRDALGATMRAKGRPVAGAKVGPLLAEVRALEHHERAASPPLTTRSSPREEPALST